MDSAAPIIVFDSGFGGISVLKELVACMPNENYLYLGDSANAPYGTRGTEEVRKLTVDAIRPLLSRNPKAIVIACNTATAAALDDVKRLCPDIPIIGIRPALQQAEQAGCRLVLSLATASTLASRSYSQQLAGLTSQTEVVSVAAPCIVKYVESGKKGRAALVGNLKAAISPVRGRRVEGVVLGCTHFPFAKDEIREAYGNDVRFFDAGADVAQETRRLLGREGLLASEGASGSVVFSSSLNEQRVLGCAWSLFMTSL